MSTIGTALRPLTAPEKLAVTLVARGVPEFAITYRTRLSPEQIAAAVDHHERWEQIGRGLPRTTTPTSTPSPPATPAAGPTPQERAVQLYAGGMDVNQVAVATGLTRARVLDILGLEPDDPRHLVPAADMPPVLQGVGGSIARQRPPVQRRPPAPKLTAPAARPNLERPLPSVPTAPAAAVPESTPRRTPADAAGSRAWKRLASSAAVRAWAIADGWAVPPPSVRLPGAIVRAYITAHPETGSDR